MNILPLKLHEIFSSVDKTALLSTQKHGNTFKFIKFKALIMELGVKINEEEIERVKKKVEEIHLIFNSKEKSLSACFEHEFINQKMEEIGIKGIEESFIEKKFGIYIYDAEDFVFWALNWEYTENGAEGGLFLGYSLATNLFYYIHGTMRRGDTNHYSLALHVLNDEGMKKWVKDGSFAPLKTWKYI
jgi:hypothetical protein